VLWRKDNNVPSATKLGSRLYLLKSDLLLPVELNWFLPGFWQEQGAVTGASQGRSATFFIHYNNHKFALRHYCRGGIIRHLFRDTYLFSSLKTTRIYAELAILEKLQEWQLAAPQPIAGLVKKFGLFYRADLLMAQIPNASDLYQLLQNSAFSKQQWQDIGVTIAQFHHHGVYHADLNCHNIMSDNNGKIWLIDFDRAKLQVDADRKARWTTENLNRLYRSLTKEKSRCNQFHFEENNWKQLLIGYHSQK
jgi:tRNA A-37 threonylcarbamoyl transferase component Bud32